MIFLRFFVLITLIFQFNIYSQKKHQDDNIEYYTLLFELNNPNKKEINQIELPGVYKELSSTYDTRLITFEKEFNITDVDVIYSLVIENSFRSEAMVKINNNFINNDIISGWNSHDINLPNNSLKKGINKISIHVICTELEGILDGDIYLKSQEEIISLNGIWDYYLNDKFINNIKNEPTQGFDLLSFGDLDIPYHTSNDLDDSKWPIASFPSSNEMLFDNDNFNGAICFRKIVKLNKVPIEDYLIKINKGIDDYDRLYVNGKLVGKTDCYSCERKYIIPKDYLKKENLFTFFIVDKNGIGGVNSEIILSNSKELLDISDTWSFKKILEMQLLISTKVLDNKNSFFNNQQFNFYSLSGIKLNFKNLLIEQKTNSNYYLLIIFLLLSILVVLFVYYSIYRKNKFGKPVKNYMIDEKKHLFIRSDRADHKILLNEIILIEGKKDYVKVSTDEKSYLVRKNLKTFLKELPTSKFVRISKSVALNKEQIEKIEKNMLFIKSGNYYIIGKKYNDGIKKLFSLNKKL